MADIVDYEKNMSHEVAELICLKCLRGRTEECG